MHSWLPGSSQSQFCRLLRTHLPIDKAIQGDPGGPYIQGLERNEFTSENMASTSTNSSPPPPPPSFTRLWKSPVGILFP